MAGVFEQIKKENKRYYDTSRFNVEALQKFAGNLGHLLIQEGKLLVGDFFQLQSMIQSEDPESIKLAIYIMETKSNTNFTTKEDGNLG